MNGPLGLANANQNLGRSAMLGRGQKEGTRAVLLQASANTKGKRRAVGDSAASTLTVSCSLAALNDVAHERPPRVVGLIEWGTDGHQCQAYFDWLQGTVIQVACSSVRVIAELAPTMVVNPAVTPDYPAAASVRVGAVVGYMPSSRVPVTFTAQARIPEEGAAIVPVPPFAASLSILGPEPSALQWLAGADTALQVGALAAGPMRDLYRVPGTATHLRIQGTAANLYNLIWTLSL